MVTARSSASFLLDGACSISSAVVGKISWKVRQDTAGTCGTTMAHKLLPPVIQGCSAYRPRPLLSNLSSSLDEPSEAPRSSSIGSRDTQILVDMSFESAAVCIFP